MSLTPEVRIGVWVPAININAGVMPKKKTTMACDDACVGNATNKCWSIGTVRRQLRKALFELSPIKHMYWPAADDLSIYPNTTWPNAQWYRWSRRRMKGSKYASESLAGNSQEKATCFASKRPPPERQVGHLNAEKAGLFLPKSRSYVTAVPTLVVSTLVGPHRTGTTHQPGYREVYGWI